VLRILHNWNQVAAIAMRWIVSCCVSVSVWDEGSFTILQNYLLILHKYAQIYSHFTTAKIMQLSPLDDRRELHGMPLCLVLCLDQLDHGTWPSVGSVISFNFNGIPHCFEDGPAQDWDL
jgi:hypothetical protein